MHHAAAQLAMTDALASTPRTGVVTPRGASETTSEAVVRHTHERPYGYS